MYTLDLYFNHTTTVNNIDKLRTNKKTVALLDPWCNENMVLPKASDSVFICGLIIRFIIRIETIVLKRPMDKVPPRLCLLRKRKLKHVEA